MFRKEYKQANDNIKIDEALLEKTLEAAFSEKPKRKAPYYRSLAPVAAAVVVVIGASLAQPRLVEEPEIEQTAMFTASPTLNPEGEMSFEAVSEPVSTPAPQNTANEKKVSAARTPKPVTSTPSAAEETEAAKEINDFDLADAQAPASAENSAAAVSEARAGGGEAPAFQGEESAEEGFTQISCKFLSGTEEYVYEDKTGKTFTVTISPEEGDKPQGIIATEKNGRLYTFTSDNMTEAEIMEAFKTLDI